jgi:hypothetical protein
MLIIFCWAVKEKKKVSTDTDYCEEDDLDDDDDDVLWLADAHSQYASKAFIESEIEGKHYRLSSKIHVWD